MVKTRFLKNDTISKTNEKKMQILMNKLCYLGLSILELSKLLTYEFRYDYLKPNMVEN